MIQATNPQQQEVLQSFQLKHMDLPSPRFFHPHQPELKPSFNGTRNNSTINTSSNSNIYNNPFADTFPDPLCKLNLKETSDFVRSLPPIANAATGSGSALRKREGMGCHQKPEAPPTPGRPIFSFGVAGKPRKSVPSKWDDAEKWLISSSTDSPSPAHHHAFRPSFKQGQCAKVSDPKLAPGFRGFVSSSSSSPPECYNVTAGATAGGSESDDVLLKDKLTDNEQPILPNLRFLMAEPPKEDFLVRNSSCSGEIMKDAAADHTGVVEVQRRDVGTEMTPLGSSTTSRCPTPFKSISPARHNTPASRSGPLSASTDYYFDMSQLQEYCTSDLGNKLQLGATKFDSCVSNWSSREEEEEEVSKSLRHFQTGNECNKNASESRESEWEEDERKKSCLRYQREEAKIQAWVNLQNAKAEARSKKLEVKIQKMRSNLEKKLMKRMAVVHRKAEEWRATAQLQHCDQIRKVGEEVQSTMMSHHDPQYLSGRRVLRGCLPCTNHRY